MKIETCFSQKPLGHFQPRFVCKLLGTGKHDAGHMAKIADMPIYGKQHFKKLYVVSVVCF